MRVVETIKNSISVKKTLMHDEIDDKYYLVSSVNNDHVNETMVFECDEYGIVDEYIEVFVKIPSNHDNVVKMLSDDYAHIESGKIVIFKY